jgi:(p)ppGpp synthase/HD superfamily hydrolase
MGVRSSGLGDAEPAVGDSELVHRAYSVALEAHEGQRRRGSREPYVTHPLAVAKRLREEGFRDEAVAAAFLHDAVEDSEVKLEQIETIFGIEVTELVAALTEDTSIEDWDERKQALREQVVSTGPDALAIYAADKLTNVCDTRVLYAREGEESGQRFEVSLDKRIGAWREDLETLSRTDVAPQVVAELRSELDALDAERASSQSSVAASS